MIPLSVDTGPTYEAMKRGEWPEPNPEVVAAHEALNLGIEASFHQDSAHRGTSNQGPKENND